MLIKHRMSLKCETIILIDYGHCPLLFKGRAVIEKEYWLNRNSADNNQTTCM